MEAICLTANTVSLQVIHEQVCRQSFLEKFSITTNMLEEKESMFFVMAQEYYESSCISREIN